MRIINDASVTSAWLKAIDASLAEPKGEIERLAVEIKVDGSLDIDPDVVAALNESLASRDEFLVQTVSSTIFPSSMWNAQYPRARLFTRYNAIYKALRKHPQNRNGLYFGRMIGAEGGKNQLDLVLNTRKRGNLRRSAYQVVVYRPEDDLTDQRQRGFPCLHQVSFVPNAHAGLLSVVGYYATQNLYEKALGNYIGLGRLGEFVAHEWGLKLGTLTCFAAIAKSGGSGAATATLRRLRSTLTGTTP